MTFPPNYFEKCECGDTDAKHRHGLELGQADPEYPGVIVVLRHAEEQGFPIHVATRSTCAEHIEEGDDQAESWALQPSLVLDVERLAQVLRAHVRWWDPDLLGGMYRCYCEQWPLADDVIGQQLTWWNHVAEVLAAAPPSKRVAP